MYFYKKRILSFLCALFCLIGFQSPIKSWNKNWELPIAVLGTILVSFYVGVIVGRESVDMESKKKSANDNCNSNSKTIVENFSNSK